MEQVIEDHPSHYLGHVYHERISMDYQIVE